MESPRRKPAIVAMAILPPITTGPPMETGSPVWYAFRTKKSMPKAHRPAKISKTTPLGFVYHWIFPERSSRKGIPKSTAVNETRIAPKTLST